MPTALARGRDPALRRPAARPERGGFIQTNRHACEGIAVAGERRPSGYPHGECRADSARFGFIAVTLAWSTSARDGVVISGRRDSPHSCSTSPIWTHATIDSAALAAVIEDLKGSGFEPSELLADTAYGGDENHSRAAPRGSI